ncbi:L,D-transpeptidase [Rhodobacter ferrooxidans]|uniref:ErfK/YbiS/YcfS/YnhG family protein n=1 Tax=Rhodobacter ferrooxidans TaxID=371731 RepID=C8RYZ3_9RHOB|nr:L,D-transpeptidase [Rhodobacter sp. SW2]EEW25950.1 ErfK/YbiS/YcfS/YnhG family protein [Rhodobacter sp. SW2]
MTTGVKGMVLAGFVVAALSACVPDPNVVQAGMNAPPTPAVFTDAYAAGQDSGIAIPAIPLDKLPAQFQRQTVAYQTEEVPGTIIINPSERLLYLVTGKNKAIRYGIAVGKAGFEWAGVANVAERKLWPTWTPPKEMIARKPELARWEKGQPGGPTNPLGARALYLNSNGRDYGYRIHGTPDWQSIGHNASSGCIRMINQDVIDLFQRVPENAKVIVLNRDGSVPTAMVLPPPVVPRRVAPPVAPVTPVVAPVLPNNGLPAFVPALLPPVPPSLAG